jgi:hypothetical protein
VLFGGPVGEDGAPTLLKVSSKSSLDIGGPFPDGDAGELAALENGLEDGTTSWNGAARLSLAWMSCGLE